MPRANPHERLLTRALGVGRWWMSVATIAAAGSTFAWMREQLFSDLSESAFWKLVARQSEQSNAGGLVFEPYLAGERTSIEQRSGAFKGLTMSSTRQHMLSAVIDALARTSAERLPLLAELGQSLDRRVIVSGGMQKGLGDVLYRDWRGKWTFQREADATLRGLGTMTPRAR